MRRLFLGLATSLLLLELGCPTEPAARPAEPKMPEDEWTVLPTSMEWLHALGDYSGDHKAECDRTLGWVRGESGCKGAICEHGKNLASDWLARCAKIASGAADDVKTLEKDLEARAAAKADDCETELVAVLRDGRCDDKTCAGASQRWATRCAKSSGSPLAVRLLERTVERKMEQPTAITLDPKTCEELRAELLEGARCRDLFACQDQAKFAEVYRDRCENDANRPSIAAATLELAIFSGANLAAKPISVAPASPIIAPSDVPVALGDGSGAIVMVCDQRLGSLDQYLGARRTCADGKLVMARAFKTGSKVEVRLGSIDFPNDALFALRFPTLVAAGENEARDKAALKPFDTALARIGEEAKAAPGEAVKDLEKLMASSALAMRRSKELLVTLTSRDADLALAFAELGKQKAQAAKQRISSGDLAGLAQRGETRPFADVSPDGQVQPGSWNRASGLDLASALPRAMAAYTAAMKPVFTSARARKPDRHTATTTKAHGIEGASLCGGAERKMQETKQSIVSCAFALEVCDEARIASLTKSIDEARQIAESSFHDADVARTGAGAVFAADIAQAMEASGCREPWW